MAVLPRNAFENRRKARWLLAAGAILLISGVVLLSQASRLTPHVRNRVVAALEDRFDSTVQLDEFQVSMFPRPEVWGRGLSVYYKGQKDGPPLIAIREFSAGASVVGLIGAPLHLRSVTLEGLDIRVPSGGLPESRGTAGREESPLVIDRITSTDARFEIASKRPGKLPRTFEIHDLVLTDFGFDRAAAFRASLTNPTPRGRIATEGSFGPWQRENPRMTPVSGTYDFAEADMNTIKGIAGRLSSTGKFNGVLERISVSGQTRTPDFRVDVAGQPVDLRTRFDAVVDGTSGDTWLDPVEATFGRTSLRAKGAVIRAQDVKGRLVSLAVTIPKGRIEDVLKFAMKPGEPPITGDISLTTSFSLPPGAGSVLDRLQLDGRFDLAQARFTSFDVQRKIDTLSRRGSGDSGPVEGSSVVSGLKGRFVLKSGVLSLPQLTFAVPGAAVQLAGSYDLGSEQMDFRGHLLLDANLSETTTGVKSALARLAQPLFRRPGGGSKLPIRVSGHRSKPSFGLDVKRALTPGN